MIQDEPYSSCFEHIISAAEKAQEFVDGMNYQDFVSDDKTSFAVIRCLEVIGEAAGRIPDFIRQDYPGIPWREMINTRNLLIHNYDTVRLDIVWNTVSYDLSPLIANLSP